MKGGVCGERGGASDGDVVVIDEMGGEVTGIGGAGAENGGAIAGIGIAIAGNGGAVQKMDHRSPKNVEHKDLDMQITWTINLSSVLIGVRRNARRLNPIVLSLTPWKSGSSERGDLTTNAGISTIRNHQYEACSNRASS